MVSPAQQHGKAVTVAAVDGGLPQLFVLPRRADRFERVVRSGFPSASATPTRP
jgi:hypothetical protein